MKVTYFDASQIASARKHAGLSQKKAAALVGASYRTWQAWEYGINSLNPAAWELFLLKTDQHPTHCLTEHRWYLDDGAAGNEI